MRGVIISENKILNNALEKGLIDKKPVITLGILARHYFNEMVNVEDKEIDMKVVKDSIFNLLSKFMEKNYEGYKASKWNSVINKTIDIYKDNIDKWQLVDVKEVYITEDEWKLICSLGDDVLERLAFVMLVYQKVNIIKNPKSDSWINTDIGDIFKEAKITLKGDAKIFKINDLYNKGYITQSHNCASTSIKLEYTNTESKNKIHIDNFNNIISYYYEVRDKKKYRECKECGIRFEYNPKAKKQKYCKKCAKKVNIKKTTESNLKCKTQ